MKKLMFAFALLGLGALTGGTAMAQQNQQQGAAGGECQAGQMRDPNGQCVDASGQMPTTKHQQEVLSGEKGKEEQKKTTN